MLNVDGAYVGMATTFMNYSTFKRQPYLYLHDVVIHQAVRGQGWGKYLMKQLIKVAKEAGCCKISLEVRTDNPAAQATYQKMGFAACTPTMMYWEKGL
ncbi:MAG TPA: hypothetical protein DD409_06055 [Bacteroidales bacterium]|nr:hypothetical protein [Bacteroidales bacterium]